MVLVDCLVKEEPLVQVESVVQVDPWVLLVLEALVVQLERLAR